MTLLSIERARSSRLRAAAVVIGESVGIPAGLRLIKVRALDGSTWSEFWRRASEGISCLLEAHAWGQATQGHPRRAPGDVRNSCIASSTKTPPVIAIGANGAFAAISALEIMI